jgi:hypothetical protein
MFELEQENERATRQRILDLFFGKISRVEKNLGSSPAKARRRLDQL